MERPAWPGAPAAGAAAAASHSAALRCWVCRWPAHRIADIAARAASRKLAGAVHVSGGGSGTRLLPRSAFSRAAACTVPTAAAAIPRDGPSDGRCSLALNLPVRPLGNPLA